MRSSVAVSFHHLFLLVVSFVYADSKIHIFKTNPYQLVAVMQSLISIYNHN